MSNFQQLAINSTFLIFYPPLENSTTRTVIMSANKVSLKPTNSFIVSYKLKGSGLTVESSDDDDADVTMVPVRNRENSGKIRKKSESCSSSGVSSGGDDSRWNSRDDILTLLDIRRRSSGVLESLKNFMCVGSR